MSFFDMLFKGAKATAQNVGHKTGEIIEVTKLNFSVSAEEEKIEKIFIALGKRQYEAHCAGQTEEEFVSICEEIDSEEAKIRLLQRAIAELKQTSNCKSCNAIIKKDALFCPKCGIRI